jgi:hypothetical protein
MSVLELLASRQGQKGDEVNITLAKEIAASGNKEAIAELVTHLKNKDKNVQSDCIKTLYETGYRNPELIVPYLNTFMEMLSGKNNRMIWGSMIALTTIADIKHREIFDSLDVIMQTVDKGSVITIDCGVMILAALNKHKAYFGTTNPLLMEQLVKCPIKQLPMYAERSLICITDRNRDEFRNLIENRLNECERDSQKKRLQKVLKAIVK